MRLISQVLVAMLGIATAAQAAETYPVYQTEPLRMPAGDNLKYLRLFESTGDFIKTSSGKSAFIVETYTLKNEDDDEFTLCGSALLGKTSEAKPTVFVISHTKLYLDVGDDGWQKLGCGTKGGTILKWVPRKDGTGGSDIRAFYTAAASSGSPPPPAKPPAGPLPLATRMQFVAEFENDLSQAIGREVIVTSLHIYDEQDGDTTMCIIGSAERTKFRLMKSKGKTVTDPTQGQWITAGCTRPGYQLMR